MGEEPEALLLEMRRRVALTARAGRDLPACCRQAARERYARYLKDCNAVDRPDLCGGIVLGAIDRVAPLLWGTFERVELRVMSSRPFLSAWVGKIPCRCGRIVPLIAVNANLLLLVWRLTMVHVTRVERWEVGPDGMRVSVRPPERRDIDQMRLAVDMYLNGSGVSHAGLDTLLGDYNAADGVARRALLTVVELAELWVVLHECGHTLMELPGAARFNERFENIDRFARSCVETLSPLPQVQDNWRREHQADLCATLYLMAAVGDGPLVARDPEEDRPHNAVWLALGGVAAAMEALNYIEAAHHERPGFSFRAHPPAFQRWAAVRRYAAGCVPPIHQASVQTLADLMGRLSTETMGRVFA